jgi:ribonuclease HI
VLLLSLQGDQFKYMVHLDFKATNNMAEYGALLFGLSTCHTPFRERGNEASIRVPRMFKSHAWQQYDKQMQCYE